MVRVPPVSVPLLTSLALISKVCVHVADGVQSCDSERTYAESLSKVSTEPRPTPAVNPSERTDPGREPVWDDWFR